MKHRLSAKPFRQRALLQGDEHPPLMRAPVTKWRDLDIQQLQANPRAGHLDPLIGDRRHLLAGSRQQRQQAGIRRDLRRQGGATKHGLA